MSVEATIISSESPEWRNSLPHEIVCDFCSAESPGIVRHECPEFVVLAVMPGAGTLSYHSAPDFVACLGCHDLIALNAPKALLRRSFREVPPDEFSRSLRERLIEEFFRRRTGRWATVVA